MGFPGSNPTSLGSIRWCSFARGDVWAPGIRSTHLPAWGGRNRLQPEPESLPRSLAPADATASREKVRVSLEVTMVHVEDMTPFPFTDPKEAGVWRIWHHF